MRTGASWRRRATQASLVCGLIIGVALPASTREVRVPPVPVPADRPPRTTPAPLGEADLARYRELFAHTGAGRWVAADRVVRRLGDPLLVGHALAERYLHPTAYRSSPVELGAWLDRYGDLPQAARVYRLALARWPEGRPRPPVPKQVLLLANGRAAAAQPARPGALWRAGLAAWSEGKVPEAARAFAQAAAAGGAAADERAGAAFWAARARLATGERPQAERLLALAADASEALYGVLARRTLAAGVGFDWQPARLGHAAADRLERLPAVRRAVALAQIGERELADAELKWLAAGARPELARAVARLAASFELPSAQVQAAPELTRRDGRRHDAVRYPVPRWQPAGGYELEPTFIHAVIRAESGFDPFARSPRGAVGLMQILPSTARLAAKAMRIAYRGDRWLMDPPTNMRLGQGWLRQLAARRPVDGSLIHLIAAYNAGEGRVAAWGKGPLRGAANDPLLYIESVPLDETRNYVKRVLTNLWAYQARRGGPIPSLRALAGHRWPEVEPADQAVASERRSERHARAN